MDTIQIDQTAEETTERPRSLSPWRESLDGPLLTLPAACIYLKVGKDTIRKLYESGQIKSIKVAGARRIVRESCDELIARQMTTT
jgi:excisionase family DNA binding protein